MIARIVFSLLSLTHCLIQGLYRLNREKPSLSKQRGQGLIEYLLILLLTVALVTALSRGVGRPIQTYIRRNVLDVVSCMLKVGQFPTESFGLCQESFAADLTVAENSTSDGNGGSNPSNNTSNSDTNNNNAGSNANTSSNNSGNNSNNSNIRSSNSTGALNESESDPFVGTNNKISIQSDDPGGSNNSELSIKGFQNSNGDIVIIRRIKRDGRLGGSFFISSDEKEVNDSITKAQTPKTVPLPAELADRVIAESSFSISKPKKRGPQNDNSNAEVEFSFFGFIKWGIIIAILVVFGFFTLSQLNSIRKGWTE